MRRIALCVLVCLALTGCAKINLQKIAPGEAYIVLGPAVRDNRTPLDTTYQCYNKKLVTKGLATGKLKGKLHIAVGEIKDYTGRYSDTEGSAITQGGSPMVFSGLAKLRNAVIVHERFDTRVTDQELQYIAKKHLGDGSVYEISGERVPWMPYYGGSVKKSDFTILGGVTEVNYNIQSGGAEFRIDNAGPEARIYTMSVAADLRLVNTDTLEIVSAVSMQKQFTGYEVGIDVFRFFGLSGKDRLFDVNAGNKSQEPLQLGVRAILEEAVLKLIADATAIPYEDCKPEVWEYPEMVQALKDDPKADKTTDAPAATIPKPVPPVRPAAPAKPPETAKPSTESKAPEGNKPVAAPSKPPEAVKPAMDNKTSDPAKPAATGKPPETIKPAVTPKSSEPAKPATDKKASEPAESSGPKTTYQLPPLRINSIALENKAVTASVSE